MNDSRDGTRAPLALALVTGDALALVTGAALALVTGVALAACGSAAASGASAGAAPTVASASESATASVLASFAGSYPAVSFEPSENTCGSPFTNGVTAIIVDADAHVVYTVGEERRYAARVEADELVADGYFGGESSGLCDEDSRFYERWRFRKQPDGALRGAVEGLWPLPPEHCARPCRVAFSVTTGASTGPGRAPPPDLREQPPEGALEMMHR
jgi:hypothetical protein